MSDRYDIETFGCKVNSYDAGLIQKRLKKSGLNLDSDSPDVHILNTCAVTAEATKDAIRRVRKLKKQNPNATVVVTGCAAQVDTEKFEGLAEADLVVANSHKGQLDELIAKHRSGELTERIFKSNIFKKEDLEIGGGEEAFHTRSFLKIQDGCNSFCTYCVIPFARGKSRSIPIQQLVTKINELHSDGVQEVVLTGVHIGDYEDGPYVLEDLIEQTLKQTRIPRVRMTSFEPVELNERLIDLYQDERMCSHFHMSIQSAETSVLKNMKRNYSAKEVEWALNFVHNKLPGSFVGMDVIVGFPGETENEYLETYERLKSLPWTRIHVFPYSERPGTYATRLKDKWDRSLILERAKHLRTLSSERYAEAALSQVGSVKKALLLNSKDHVTRGVSRDYWNLQISSVESLPVGTEISVKVTGFDHSEQSRMDGILIAEPLA